MTETFFLGSIYKRFSIPRDSKNPVDLAKRKEIDGLFADHKNRIKRVMDDHEILIDPKKFDRVVFETWDDIQMLKLNRKPYCGVKTAKDEIRRLLSAINSLSPSARHILNKSAKYTNHYLDFLETGEYVRSDLNYVITGFSLGLLGEACAVALLEKPLSGIYEKDSEYEIVPIVKNGRPVNFVQRMLCFSFWRIFENYTGKKASDSVSGPFDDFVTACMTTFDPNWMTTMDRSNRKLIRVSVPKYAYKTLASSKPPKKR